MAEIRAFRGLRYDETLAGPLGDLICPPYDVIDDADRERLVERSPFNFVRVELPRPDGDPYAAAAATLSGWRQRKVLKPESADAIYVHDHEFAIGKARARRRGVHVALRLHALDEGIVMPHELTFPKAKADRLVRPVRGYPRRGRERARPGGRRRGAAPDGRGGGRRRAAPTLDDR